MSKFVFKIQDSFPRNELRRPSISLATYHSLYTTSMSRCDCARHGSSSSDGTFRDLWFISWRRPFNWTPAVAVVSSSPTSSCSQTHSTDRIATHRQTRPVVCHQTHPSAHLLIYRHTRTPTNILSQILAKTRGRFCQGEFCLGSARGVHVRPPALAARPYVYPFTKATIQLVCLFARQPNKPYVR